MLIGDTLGFINWSCIMCNNRCIGCVNRGIGMLTEDYWLCCNICFGCVVTDVLGVLTVGALGMSTNLCMYMSRHVNRCIGC